MRKISIITLALGIIGLGSVAALADDTTPPPPPQKQAAQPAQTDQHRAHQRGMQHGGQQMHDRMMQDHRKGMQTMQGHSGMPNMQAQPGMPKMEGHSGMSMGCGSSNGGAGCDAKKDKPQDQSMPMNDM